VPHNVPVSPHVKSSSPLPALRAHFPSAFGPLRQYRENRENSKSGKFPGREIRQAGQGARFDMPDAELSEPGAELSPPHAPRMPAALRHSRRARPALLIMKRSERARQAPARQAGELEAASKRSKAPPRSPTRQGARCEREPWKPSPARSQGEARPMPSEREGEPPAHPRGGIRASRGSGRHRKREGEPPCPRANQGAREQAPIQR
jgi:hypothetical protein